MLSLPASFCLVLPLAVVHEMPIRKQKSVTHALMLVTAIIFLAIAFRFPYNAEHPKRIYMQHISREWFRGDKLLQQDSGMWINSLDYRNLHDHLHQNLPFMLEGGQPRSPAPCVGVFCSFPWYFPIQEMVSGGMYIPSEKPPGSIQVEVVRDVHSHLRTLSLRISGPTHMALVLRQEGWALRDWSFGKVEVMDGERARVFDTSLAPFVYRSACRCYFLFRATGNSSIPWEFDLVFNNPNTSDRNLPLELVVYGHDMEARTPALEETLRTLPDWVTPVSFLSFWQMHSL